MFFREPVRLRLPAATVRPRLLRLCQSDAITVTSERALDQAALAAGVNEPAARIAPPDTDHDTPHVRLVVQILPASTWGRVTIVPIRWWWPDMLDRPLLDADLELEPSVDDATCQLRLVGVLHPTPPNHAATDQLHPRVFSLRDARRFLGLIGEQLTNPPG
ncbi:MAG TPA: hypothetical protein VFP34_08720 [Microlunatus sp.]|nr:hypothetical protein [Microlunatus sp.]